jgi:hypothetical protein
MPQSVEVGLGVQGGFMDTGNILTAASILAGATLVALQLFLQRRWNIQKSTEEIANRFIEPAMYQHWNVVQASVVEQHRKWEDISTDEQQSVRMLMSYFETLGILARRRIVDRQMLDEFFHDVVILLHDCTKDYLPKLRKQRQSELVYTGFEYLAGYFQRRIINHRS